ncbi:hypothetical protein KKJ06_09285 [Xenorhabdus bovienii]|nr:hypothetical protein [Xenorhabdus bovienii]MDE9488108.1 hypothetical protein [Xenorhabdus bovienii]MDE9555621.1 hypothetical protein [Xenorhabdus bovienii]CDH30410.1 conserved membrane hypothetical protein [Xenorhabdus bovienii str. Jollieti]
MSHKTISPSKYVYIYHILCFYISISCLFFYIKSPAIPFIIWIGMIFITAIIVFHRKIGPLPKIKLKTKISSYTISIILSMLSSLFFLTSCFIFTFIENSSSQTDTIATFILFLLCLCISILTFTSNSINRKNDNFSSVLLTTFKIIWILLSYLFYSHSRNTVAEIFDISYESTLSKPTTIGLTIISIMIIYSIFIGLSPVLLMFFEKAKSFTRKKTKEIHYSSAPIAIPVLLSWFIIYILFNINIHKAINTIIDVTIPMETRSTFFCHEKYMILPEGNTTRYMSLENDEYRAFIKTENSWEVSKLKCQNKKPYYKLIPVKTIENINKN